MFGLTETEMEGYRNLAQDFAVQEAAPQILSQAECIVPNIMVDGEIVPDINFINQILTDLETIITLTTSHMAYDYAYLQAESEMNESEILKHLHTKYEDYAMVQMIKYGIAFSSDVTREIIGTVILELPYLYIMVVESEDFDEDDFLEERLDSYNAYIENNFGALEEDEEDLDD